MSETQDHYWIRVARQALRHRDSCDCDECKYVASILDTRFGPVYAEVERLREGKFTPEEFHNLCHNLEKSVTPEEFDKGCAEYQVKLFGRCPTTEQLQRKDADIAELRAALIKAKELLTEKYEFEVAVDLIDLLKRTDSPCTTRISA